MPLDVDATNKLLNIYLQLQSTSNTINANYAWFRNNQLMNGADLEELYIIQLRVDESWIILGKLINEYVDEKGIRDIMEKERFVPNDI